MYIVGQNPLKFINPLQVESIRYAEETLVLNAQGSGQGKAIIRMASGDEITIDKETARGTSIDEAVKKLVFQIDVANGMKFTKEKDPKIKDESQYRITRDKLEGLERSLSETVKNPHKDSKIQTAMENSFKSLIDGLEQECEEWEEAQND